MTPTGARTRVKICGITTAEDAALAIEAGADALGFNSWTGSKRYLRLEEAQPWLQELPPFITRVALTVNATLEEARRIAAMRGIDVVQVHGDEDADYCRELAAHGRPVIKALRVGSVEDLAAAALFPQAALLLDAKVVGEFGGTGVPVELALAQEFQRLYPRRALILAGGLTPENVARAVHLIRPHAVDVSSGVEGATPGRKDPGRLRAFIQAAHSA